MVCVTPWHQLWDVSHSGEIDYEEFALHADDELRDPEGSQEAKQSCAYQHSFTALSTHAAHVCARLAYHDGRGGRGVSVSNVEWSCKPILRRWRSVDKPSMFGTQVGEEDWRGAEEGRQEVCGSRLPCATIVDLRRLGQDDALRRSHLAPSCTSPIRFSICPRLPPGQHTATRPFSCLCTSCTPRSRPRGHARSNVHQCALSVLGQRRRSRRSAHELL